MTSSDCNRARLAKTSKWDRKAKGSRKFTQGKAPRATQGLPPLQGFLLASSPSRLFLARLTPEVSTEAPGHLLPSSASTGILLMLHRSSSWKDLVRISPYLHPFTIRKNSFIRLLMIDISSNSSLQSRTSSFLSKLLKWSSSSIYHLLRAVAIK